MTDRPSPRVATARMVALDIAGPLLLFYGLRGLGVSDVLALTAGAVPPIVNIVMSAMRERRLEPVAVAALLAMTVGLVASLTAGGPRELLARGAWLSAPSGLWMLATLLWGRPFCFIGTQRLLPHRAEVMDRLWATEPRFRQVWRSITVCWAAVSLADSALRVVMAYTLPVPVVPALDTALSLVTIVLLQLPTHLLLRRAGFWDALFGRRRAPEQVPEAV